MSFGAKFSQIVIFVSKYFAGGTVYPFASANMQVYAAPTNWEVLDGLVARKAVPYLSCNPHGTYIHVHQANSLCYQGFLHNW